MSDDNSHEISQETFARFIEAQASEAEKDAIARHLSARCHICCRRLESAIGMPASRHFDGALVAGPSGEYEEAFAAAQRALVRELERQRRSLDSLLAELDRMPAAEQEMKVKNGRRFASCQLALALVQRSHEQRHDDPAEMLHFAGLAVTAAERAPAGGAGGEPRLHDCRARAWGQFGNALRVSARIPEAEAALAEALRHMEQGTGDLDLRAWFFQAISSVHVYRRSFREAQAALAEAIAAHSALHDRAGEASALISLGLAHVHACEMEAAIPPLNRALKLLPEHEMDLRRIALLNLAWCYAEMRLPQQAHVLVPFLEKHFAACTDEVNLLRFDWLRGVIERDAGLVMTAELRLVWARAGFMRKELPFESALISLDLAEVYVHQRREAHAIAVIGEAIPILQGLGVARDLLAALLRLRELAGQQQAALALLRDVAQAVKAGAAQASP